MPQIVHNQQINPHYYQSLSGALLTPFAGQMGQQLGEGLGYMGRHLLFGDNPGEQLQLAQAEHQNEVNDDHGRALLIPWDIENPNRPDSEKLAQAQKLGIRGITNQSGAQDASIYTNRNASAIGQAAINSFNPDGTPMQEEPTSPGPAAASIPYGQKLGPSTLFSAMPGPSGGGAPALNDTGIAPSSGQNPGTIAPSRETQISASNMAQTDRGPQPTNIAPPVPEAAEQTAAKIQATAGGSIPPPQFTPAQKLQGQALLNQIGARITANRQIAAGTYTPESAAMLTGLYSSTDAQVRKLGDLTSSAMGTGPNTVGLRDHVNQVAFMTKNNPELFRGITDPGARAVIEKQAAEFATRNYNKVEMEQLAQLNKAIPMDSPTFQSQLASLVAHDNLHSAAVQRESVAAATARANGEYAWKGQLQPYMVQDAQAAAKMKGISATHFDEQMQLTMDGIKQELYQKGNMYPVLKDHAVLQNMSAQAALYTTQLDQQLKAEEFVGGQESKTLMTRLGAFERIKMFNTAEIDKIMKDPTNIIPGAPQAKANQEQIKVLQQGIQGADAAAQDYLKTSQNRVGPDGRAIPSTGDRVRGLAKTYGKTMDEIIQSGYTRLQQDATNQNCFADPFFYVGRTTLMSHKPDGTSVNLLPTDTMARGWAVAAARHVNPQEPKMSKETFLAMPVPTPDKGPQPLNAYIKDSTQLNRLFQLYSDWADTGRIK